MVKVERDEKLPFVVTTDTAAVEAIGTQFNVYVKEDTTEVTVVEGRVRVDWGATQGPRDGSARQLQLDSGHKAIVAANVKEPTPSPVDVNRVTAWTERRLSFDDTTVAEVAAELNRYNRTRVVVSDPDLASRRISGAFDVNDPSAFIALLGGLKAVEVQIKADGARSLRYKSDH